MTGQGNSAWTTGALLGGATAAAAALAVAADLVRRTRRGEPAALNLLGVSTWRRLVLPRVVAGVIAVALVVGSFTLGWWRAERGRRDEADPRLHNTAAASSRPARPVARPIPVVEPPPAARSQAPAPTPPQPRTADVNPQLAALTEQLRDVNWQLIELRRSMRQLLARIRRAPAGADREPAAPKRAGRAPSAPRVKNPVKISGPK